VWKIGLQQFLSPKERLEQLEASHISLMTEHELEVKESDQAWRRHRRWLREYDSSPTFAFLSE